MVWWSQILRPHQAGRETRPGWGVLASLKGIQGSEPDCSLSPGSFNHRMWVFIDQSLGNVGSARHFRQTNLYCKVVSNVSAWGTVWPSRPLDTSCREATRHMASRVGWWTPKLERIWDAIKVYRNFRVEHLDSYSIHITVWKDIFLLVCMIRYHSVIYPPAN